MSILSMSMPTGIDTSDGRRDFLSAIPLPDRLGRQDAHLVMYVRPECDDVVVAMLVHDDEAQKSFLRDGEYDLTLEEALASLTRRLTQALA